MPEFNTTYPTTVDSAIDDPKIYTTMADRDLHIAQIAAAVVALETKAGTGTVVTIATDTFFVAEAGAPVDYTDGSPPATGEAVYGPGSIYVDITNKKMYLNVGTKAQPLWAAGLIAFFSDI